MKNYNWHIRSQNGEIEYVSGSAASYMEAQNAAQQFADHNGRSVYLWFGNRAPVAINPRNGGLP